MTPQEFIAKWQRVQLSERSACQQHFLDLCELLGQPKPAAEDPDGSFYTFERGVTKTEGGRGWADVWLRGHFGWEYKGKHKDLTAAYKQLLLYREDLENPPLLVVCDLDRFAIHTNFTGTAKKVYAFPLADLAQPANLDVLRKLFTDPEALRPGQTTAAITEDAAKRFATIADGMRSRGVDAHAAAHFVMKLVFCMFGEDIGLLPEKVFSATLAGAKRDPGRLSGRLRSLFTAMAKGGDFGPVSIPWFNGGLFIADEDVSELTPTEIDELAAVNDYDWSNVEPSIFGTLFERSLDPSKRSQIGAHYTSRDDILTLLEPVVMAPLRREWAEVRAKCDALWEKIRTAGGRHTKTGKVRADTKERKAHDKLLRDFVERLADVTVLDPACGSGNFLYVAINLLMDLEKEAIAYAATHGTAQLPHVRPTQLAGLEINPYAQQLAQVVIWIGYLQWMHQNGFNAPRDPILEPIESIRLTDAILDLADPEHPKEPEWPAADFIVGNPPFLGGKRIRGECGHDYFEQILTVFNDVIPPFSDLCCYWFEKARKQIEQGKSFRAGLLATQAIRGGANRVVLDRVKQTGDIFFGISDRDWILDGATVHVSMVGFDNGSEKSRTLDETDVSTINANLTPSADTTKARRLRENESKSFVGIQKSGPFDLPIDEALELTKEPNASGLCNSDVLRPYLNALDIVRRSQEIWIVDFDEKTLEGAAKYEKPFENVKKLVKPMRDVIRRERHRIEWWRYGETRQGMRTATKGFARMLVTPLVAKHFVVTWIDTVGIASNLLIGITTTQDADFGLLNSRIHHLWARSMGTQLRESESGSRYTPTTCFETFPFPEPTTAQREAIAAAARELDTLRNNWVNPPEWTRQEVLEFPGSVDGPWARYVHDPNAQGIGTVRYQRLVPKDADASKKLAKRTLTNLYNERPTWLDLAHKKLDAAVFDAYGWPADLSDDDLLARLLALNLERAAAEAS
jgi:hypothetical protein